MEMKRCWKLEEEALDRTLWKKLWTCPKTGLRVEDTMLQLRLTFCVHYQYQGYVTATVSSCVHYIMQARCHIRNVKTQCYNRHN